jgi:hypothetical protein
MAKLQKYHDVTTFCSDKPLETGAPQDHVKYDAKTQSLVACDGKIAIVVPVTGECDAPDALIPKGKIAAAADKQQDLAALDGGKLALNKKEVIPNGNADVTKFGNVFGVMQGHEPDLVIPLSLETLEPLVAYTKQHGTGGIYLCVDHAPGGNWQERQITGAIQFFFDVATDEKDADVAQAVGVLMPCLMENMQAVHSRVRAAIAVANAGKSEKEKAAAARKKAAERKAAKAADATPAPANRKQKGQVALAPDDEPDTEVVAAAPKGKGQAEGKAVTPSTSSNTAKATQPKATQPSRSGSGLELADLLTRAQASLSRQKFAAARRFLGTARAEIESGEGDAEMLAKIDALDVRISKEKATLRKKGS